MNYFYRYLRPLQYNFKRNTVEIPPHGGICFRVIDEGNDAERKIINVSYSICRDTDLFDKEVAKKIADLRFIAGNSYKLQVSSLAVNVIALAMVNNWQQTRMINENVPRDLYRYEELARLAQSIIAIRNTHRVAWQLESMNHEVIKSLGIQKLYNEKQNRQHS